MLQVKIFTFDLHKPKGKQGDDISKEICDWLKTLGTAVVITDDSTPIEIGTGHLLWPIWYEDYNNEKEDETKHPSAHRTTGITSN